MWGYYSFVNEVEGLSIRSLQKTDYQLQLHKKELAKVAHLSQLG